MKKELIITDLTRMSGGRVCIAGYTRDVRCVRPELARGFFAEWWLDRGTSGVVRPFAVVEFDLQHPKPRPPHTEDWIVASGPPVFRGTVPVSERINCLFGMADDDVVSIFAAPIHHGPGFWVAPGEGSRSLGTVRAHSLTVYHQPKTSGGGWEYRLRFRDPADDEYTLTVTDLAFRYFVDAERAALRISGDGWAGGITGTFRAARDVYLRISLAREWPRGSGRCHLQINGIHSNPDYLGGRCFADFIPTKDPSIGTGLTSETLDDLPF